MVVFCKKPLNLNCVKFAIELQQKGMRRNWNSVREKEKGMNRKWDSRREKLD